MKGDNDLILGVTIDQYVDTQNDTPEVNTEFSQTVEDEAATPDVVRDQEDPDEWGATTGVTDDGSDAVS